MLATVPPPQATTTEIAAATEAPAEPAPVRAEAPVARRKLPVPLVVAVLAAVLAVGALAFVLLARWGGR